MSSVVRKIVYDAMYEAHRLDPEKWAEVIDAAVSRLEARTEAGEPDDRGEAPKLIYIVYQNTDLMEGKGTMHVKGYFASEAAAYEFVMTKLSTDMGGKKSAAINEQYVAESVEEWLETEPKSRKVWGYRKDWAGHWTEGWVDNRDAPTADPEFFEYQRLKKKFEGLS